MKLSRVISPSANYLGMLLLVAFLVAPFYFAHNFTQVEMVAGVNTQAPASPSTLPFVLIPQADKFPNLAFAKNGDIYKISFTKMGPSQAFMEVASLQNPGNSPQN
ncbi:MAG: hypothetical protein ACHQVK_03050, partial [Candidatus Paceibacterales bacterium]